jgi:hypothetical protein
MDSLIVSDVAIMNHPSPLSGDNGRHHAYYETVRLEMRSPPAM